MQHARKKDLMHTPIVETLIGVGAAVKETYQFPKMLDILVAYRGELFWAEIKNNPKTADKDLTPAERELIDTFARVGVKIHVWSSPDEALRAIGAKL
jgi:hypothetical protein